MCRFPACPRKVFTELRRGVLGLDYMPNQHQPVIEHLLSSLLSYSTVLFYVTLCLCDGIVTINILHKYTVIAVMINHDDYCTYFSYTI